jgi:hypothetical protein
LLHGQSERRLHHNEQAAEPQSPRRQRRQSQKPPPPRLQQQQQHQQQEQQQPSASHTRRLLGGGAAAAGPDELGCTHFGACAGCTLNSGLASPPTAARAAAFFESLGAPEGAFRVTAGPAAGWRCRAKLAVRGRAGAPVVGLFGAGSHVAVDIPECR